MEGLTLLRLRIACPFCGRPPALRITPAEQARHYSATPDEIIGTYQCHVERCRETYAIPASAYQRALE